MRFVPVLLAASLAAVPLFSAPAIAEEDALFNFGGDTYQAGSTVTVSEDTGSVFAAGEDVSISSILAGSAHTAGRNVTIDGAVSGNAYAAGMNIDLRGPVAGDATFMGYSISLFDNIGGNLRATGSEVNVYAPVAGSALIAGENVEIAAEIKGDLALAAQDIAWGEGAVVLGEVTLYVDDGMDVNVPNSVASAERVTIENTSKWKNDHGEVSDKIREHAHKWDKKPSFGERIGDFIGGVLFVGIVAFLLAALAPSWVAGLRGRALDNPLKALAAGFVGLSALAGSVIGFALTGLGIILIPFAILGAVFIGGLGYVLGAYALGVWLTMQAGRAEPENTGDRAIAAFAGAAGLSVIGLIPFVGWWVALFVAWVGAGAIFLNWLLPRLYPDAD